MPFIDIDRLLEEITVSEYLTETRRNPADVLSRGIYYFIIDSKF